MILLLIFLSWRRDNDSVMSCWDWRRHNDSVMSC